MLIAVAFAAGLVLAQAATPTAAAPEPAKAAKAEKPKKPKMICTEETPVGSFIAKRVCRTPEQVEADRATAERQTGATLDHLRVCQGATC